MGQYLRGVSGSIVTLNTPGRQTSWLVTCPYDNGVYHLVNRNTGWTERLSSKELRLLIESHMLVVELRPEVEAV